MISFFFFVLSEFSVGFKYGQEHITLSNNWSNVWVFTFQLEYIIKLLGTKYYPQPINDWISWLVDFCPLLVLWLCPKCGGVQIAVTVNQGRWWRKCFCNKSCPFCLWRHGMLSNVFLCWLALCWTLWDCLTSDSMVT